jgi:hypothetical protein
MLLSLYIEMVGHSAVRGKEACMGKKLANLMNLTQRTTLRSLTATFLAKGTYPNDVNGLPHRTAVDPARNLWSMYSCRGATSDCW